MNDRDFGNKKKNTGYKPKSDNNGGYANNGRSGKTSDSKTYSGSSFGRNNNAKSRFSDKKFNDNKDRGAIKITAQNESISEADATDEDEENSLIFGRNAVIEALKSERDIDKIFIRSGEIEGSLKLISSQARAIGIPVIETGISKLDALCAGGAHQGVAALVSAVNYVTVEDILKKAEDAGEPPFIVICDGVCDPHNLGAIMRSAECTGAHGMILPKRRSSPVTGTVAKASAGAVSYLSIAKVSNLASTIDELKKRNIWIYGAEAGGSELFSTDMRGGAAIVLGSEGEGVSRLVKDKCDFIVSIPMYGKVNSFNVSCAASVILSEVARQRHKAE